jgi:hypothetical protein
MCAPAADQTAAAGEVKAFAGERPCILENTATVVKMFEKLGDTRAMAMLVAAYYH